MKPTAIILALVLAGASIICLQCGGPTPAPAVAPAPAPPHPAAPATPAATPAKQKAPPPAAAPAKLTAPATPAAPHKVTIYRDTWGVPHIYADNAVDAAYAIGYCQAEDRLNDIFLNIRAAIGRLAEAVGPDKRALQFDYFMRLARNAELCRKYWKTAPPELQAIGDAYVRGVQAYMADHPDKKPAAALQLHGWQCAAVGRAEILHWPIGTILDDYSHRHQDPGTGSNEWAVAPSRSAEGCAILLTDVHVTWEGLSNFYEARVHAGDLNMDGFMIVGSPLIGLGHNDHVGWAFTTGGPDTSDCYRMKVDFSDPLHPKYEYDGKWLPIQMKQFVIKVKGQKPVIKPAAYTQLGPLIGPPDIKKGIAYVGASPYFSQSIKLFEEFYAMCRAKNVDDFYKALSMNELMEQNVMFADTDGNIEYVRGGRVPIRPEGYNWDAPVPGDTSATKWLGIHSIKDLVQCKNPPQGYMANTNISPQFMMKNSPMTPDKYKKYIYNVTWDTNNPRGKRIVQLLDADKNVTKAKAKAYAMDVYDILAPAWQSALKTAVDTVGKARMQDPDFAKTVNEILAWNGEFSRDSVAAPVVRYWRLKCQNAINIVAIADRKPLSLPDQAKMLSLLSDTLTQIKSIYGKLGITWGDVLKVGRGGIYYGCGGAKFGGGKDKKNLTNTLRDTQGVELKKGSGVYIADQGSCATTLMFMHKDGIEAYTATPWGESSDPTSKHYMDQGEKLYSKRRFKPTWWKKADLLKHVESKEELVVK